MPTQATPKLSSAILGQRWSVAVTVAPGDASKSLAISNTFKALSVTLSGAAPDAAAFVNVTYDSLDLIFSGKASWVAEAAAATLPMTYNFNGAVPTAILLDMSGSTGANNLTMTVQGDCALPTNNPVFVEDLNSLLAARMHSEPAETANGPASYAPPVTI